MNGCGCVRMCMCVNAYICVNANVRRARVGLNMNVRKFAFVTECARQIV